MKKYFISFLCLFTLSIAAIAQQDTKGFVDDLIIQRQEAYQNYFNGLPSIDTTKANFVDFASRASRLISVDSALIEQYLLNEFERAKTLDSKLEISSKEIEEKDKKITATAFYFLVAGGAGALFFLLFLIFLILFIVKGGKAKKLRKIVAGKDEEIKAAEEKFAARENEYVEQTARYKKDVDDLKASLETERKAFEAKEQELGRQVNTIDEKIRKASQKETDLNYQIFQLEMKFKNELETTVAEKCRFENKVIDLERELSEAKLRIEEEAGRPHINENERNDMLGRISWLENEEQNLRRWAEGERQAKIDLENILNGKNSELEGIYRDRDGLWGRIHQLEGQVNDMNNHINYLNDQLGHVTNEKNSLQEQLNNAQQASDVINGLNNKIAELEYQLNELRPQAEESRRLKEQLEELIRTVDKFRS